MNWIIYKRVDTREQIKGIPWTSSNVQDIDFAVTLGLSDPLNN